MKQKFELGQKVYAIVSAKTENFLWNMSLIHDVISECRIEEQTIVYSFKNHGGYATQGVVFHSIGEMLQGIRHHIESPKLIGIGSYENN